MRPSWPKVSALPHISSKWPGSIVGVTFDISSVESSVGGGVVAIVIVVGVDAPTTASIYARNPPFLPSSSASGRRMTPHALLHPRLSIIIMYDAILRSRLRAATIVYRDDDETRSSPVSPNRPEYKYYNSSRR